MTETLVRQIWWLPPRDIAEDSQANVRNDKELPKYAPSATHDKEEPSFEAPKRDNEEPKRENDRSDKELPT
jgi:hypothetical protein